MKQKKAFPLEVRPKSHGVAPLGRVSVAVWPSEGLGLCSY